MQFYLLLAWAYLLGAVPFGLLIGWTKGVDIRTQGSKNIGATNVGRVLGKRYGQLCLMLDMLKGFAPALAGYFFLKHDVSSSASLLQWLAIGLAAVVGHVFPIYLGFRGGKGVATTIGVTLGIWPIYTFSMIVSLCAYAAVRFTTGMVSAGSITLAICFPICVWALIRQDMRLTLETGWPLLAVALAMSVLILVRHASNIQRILKGQEPAAR